MSYRITVDLKDIPPGTDVQEVARAIANYLRGALDGDVNLRTDIKSKPIPTIDLLRKKQER